VAVGLAAETVRCRDEWVGYHAMGPAYLGTPTPRNEMWYDAMSPSFHLCAMVSSSPINTTGFSFLVSRPTSIGSCCSPVRQSQCISIASPDRVHVSPTVWSWPRSELTGQRRVAWEVGYGK